MYIIGVDGGGTSTEAVIADTEGNVVDVAYSGPSNIRNIGVINTAKNIVSLVKKIKQDRDIKQYCIALAGIEEEKKDTKEELLQIFKKEGLANVTIISDQLAAFFSVADKKKGIVIIAGTGSVACGWNNNNKAKAGGWGYFADEGSAFYVGIETYREIQKGFDGRKEKTIMHDVLYKEWGIDNSIDFNYKVYDNFLSHLPALSMITSKAEEQGDITAQNILKNASKELVHCAVTVISKLELQQEKFPVVITGGMFKSQFLYNSVSKDILSFAPSAQVTFLPEKATKGTIKYIILKTINKKYELR